MKLADKFDDKYLKSLTPPTAGNRIWYDDQVKGLGLRITAAGAKAFILNYRINGRERRYTLGPYGKDQWTLVCARKRAGELRRMIESGEDPLEARNEAREAPTVADLCDRFEKEHIPKLRKSTQADYNRATKAIRAEFGGKKVTEADFADFDRLHAKVTKRAPYEANRILRVGRKMFNLAIIPWKMRQDNPVRGIAANPEEKRERYIDPDKELSALTKALAEHEDQQAADIIRLLLLTGARRGEVQAMRWRELNLDLGTWTKRSAHTKQKKLHHVALSEAAVELLKRLLAEAEEAGAEVSECVFPSADSKTGHRVEIKKDWWAICKAAGITRAERRKNSKGEMVQVVKHDARIHDLRHSFASILVSSGASLPLVGALLGHTQQSTTHRYAHLFVNPLRQATEQVAAVVTGRPEPPHADRPAKEAQARDDNGGNREASWNGSEGLALLEVIDFIECEILGPNASWKEMLATLRQEFPEYRDGPRRIEDADTLRARHHDALRYAGWLRRGPNGRTLRS